MTAEQYLNNSDYSCTFKVLEKTEKEEWHAVYYKSKSPPVLFCERSGLDDSGLFVRFDGRSLMPQAT